ncbi:MAG: HDOD domain-containing protein [Burkholderiales bacterium]|nr:HDOD domain-containing protein [Burkholderiales bacterium]
MTPEKQKIFDTLWNRMAERGDFPTLAHSIGHIVGAVQSQTDHMEKLVSAIISDFSLTQKVLRLANSAMYAPFGGEVTTVSRAVLVLGQETVGHLALGLRLLDSFKGISTDREKPKQALAQTMLTGLVARRLTENTGVRDGEEAVVCALLSRLGELLCVFYAPEEWQKIEQKMEAEKLSADAAAAAVLGISLTELGQEIAARWGLPVKLREALKPFKPSGSDQPLSHIGWLQAMSAFSGELAHAMASKNPALAKAATDRFAPLVAMDIQTTRAAMHTLSEEASTEGGWEGLADVYFHKVGEEKSGKPADAEKRLAAGVAEIARSAKECAFPVLLGMALEVLKNSLGCVRTIAFVLDPASGGYRARAGFGEPLAGKLTALSFEGGFAPDIFHLTLSSKTPIHIENAADISIRSRIPPWHRHALGDARSLMLLPIFLKERAVALLYGDWTAGETVPLAEKEGQLLRAMISEIQAAVQLV